MANLFGQGSDPAVGTALGRAYRQYVPAPQRVARQVAALPATLSGAARDKAIATITRAELAKHAPTAVAGFDLSFTATKSNSTLWAVSDESVRTAILAAHRAAVEQSLAFLEQTAAFTRTGTNGCQQHRMVGLIAVAFDHWDSRAGDPNLQTHLVVANKVIGPGGAWLSVDSRVLHHAVVMVSELYGRSARRRGRAAPAGAVRAASCGPRRSRAFELDGLDDTLMTEFSTRATQIDGAMTGVLADF